MVGNKLIDYWECLLWLYMTPNPNGTLGSRPVPSLLHSDFGEKRINRGSFGNVGELIAPIKDYPDSHNQNPYVFVWVASVEHVLSKVVKCQEALGTLY